MSCRCTSDNYSTPEVNKQMLSTSELCELPLKWGTQKGRMEERVKGDARSILGSCSY